MILTYLNPLHKPHKTLYVHIFLNKLLNIMMGQKMQLFPSFRKWKITEKGMND